MREILREIFRFEELVLKSGPLTVWAERERHYGSKRFIATSPLCDESLVEPTGKLPPGVAIDGYKPQSFRPELIVEGDDFFQLYAGMQNGHRLIVDIPRNCIDTKTGLPDPQKARVAMIRTPNEEYRTIVFIDEETLKPK